MSPRTGTTGTRDGGGGIPGQQVLLALCAEDGGGLASSDPKVPFFLVSKNDLKTRVVTWVSRGGCRTGAHAVRMDNDENISSLAGNGRNMCGQAWSEGLGLDWVRNLSIS